jgi:hypothetical protein
MARARTAAAPATKTPETPRKPRYSPAQAYAHTLISLNAMLNDANHRGLHRAAEAIPEEEARQLVRLARALRDLELPEIPETDEDLDQVDETASE